MTHTSEIDVSSLIADAVDMNNPCRRCPCILLLDTSRSVERFQHSLEQAVSDLIDSIMDDEFAASMLELGVLAFNSKVTGVLKLQEVYKTYDEHPEIHLRCEGRTHTGSAVLSALNALDQRVNEIHLAGYHTYYPILIVISDGMPQFRNGAEERERAALQQAYDSVRQRVAAGELQVLSIGIGPNCKDEVLDQLAGGEAGNGHLRLSDIRRIPELFRFISTKLVSSAVDGGGIRTNASFEQQNPV